MTPIVLVNSSAGTAAQYQGQDLVERVGEAFAAIGKPVEVRGLAPGELNDALLRARRADRPVIIAGGDGSVSAAVQVFAGTGIPLGVLPFGTYNLLAHDLGIPTDLEEAVRALAVGQERAIDLGRIGRRYFHTLAGLGFFSRVARQRAKLRERLPGAKTISAAVAAIRSLTTGGNLEVEVDDGQRTETYRTPAILITNNLMEAGSWRRARLDEGVFEVSIARGDVPFSLLRGGAAAVLGWRRDTPDIVTWRTSQVTLRFRRPRVFLSLDGELLRPRTPLRFTNVPGALTCLMAPAPARAAIERLDAGTAA